MSPLPQDFRAVPDTRRYSRSPSDLSEPILLQSSPKKSAGHKAPTQRYIGPALMDEDDICTAEKDFIDFKKSVRKAMIRKFHNRAVELEEALVDAMNEGLGRSSDSMKKKATDHEKAMEELRKECEDERRNIVHKERLRRNPYFTASSGGQSAQRSGQSARSPLHSGGEARSWGDSPGRYFYPSPPPSKQPSMRPVMLPYTPEKPTTPNLGYQSPPAEPSTPSALHKPRHEMCTRYKVRFSEPGPSRLATPPSRFTPVEPVVRGGRAEQRGRSQTVGSCAGPERWVPSNQAK